MCFSPLASFTTAALTGGVGIIAISRTTRWRELPLAAIPLVFGAQQAIEGGLWLSLPAAPTGAATAILTLLYLIIAQAFWPIYAPMAARLMEPDACRRRLMLVCLAVGLAVAGWLSWLLIRGPREAVIVNHCIVYRTGAAHPLLVGLGYLVATVLPLILSSQRILVVLGVIALVGSIVAYLFYWEAFLSVWCYFAALASLAILGHFEWARGRSGRLAGLGPTA